jgi:hypothetical protein
MTATTSTLDVIRLQVRLTFQYPFRAPFAVLIEPNFNLSELRLLNEEPVQLLPFFRCEITTGLGNYAPQFVFMDCKHVKQPLATRTSAGGKGGTLDLIEYPLLKAVSVHSILLSS